MKPKFKFSKAQDKAIDLLSGDQLHTMLFGGSRSGKTFLYLYCMVLRALKAPGSRHGAFRFRNVDARQKLMFDTFQKVMDLCFPDVKFLPNKQDAYVKYENGSEIWFCGLDDKARTEKVLGGEFATIFLNECSQISNSARIMVLTRLAQKVEQEVGRKRTQLPLRAWYDCNPPSKAHWSHRSFIEKMEPEGIKQPIRDPQNYASMQINPVDNKDNLPTAYIDMLQNFPLAQRKRFWMGEFSEVVENQLINIPSMVDAYRVVDGNTPEFTRVVVGVDPSGADDDPDKNNDDIGIIVGALGTDGNAYILEDCTIKAGPGTWGSVTASAWERHRGDCVVAEKNFGGEMVRFVIQSQNSEIPISLTSASRGKYIRIEPVAALYEKGKIRHVGYFNELESELELFAKGRYMGSKSPNRADALAWVITELFPGLTNDPEDLAKIYEQQPMVKGLQFV